MPTWSGRNSRSPNKFTANNADSPPPLTVKCVGFNMFVMFEAAATEFAFVEALPKREKSRLVKCWEFAKEISRISETEGDLLPVSFACKLLDVTRSRIDQFVQDGRLKRFDVDGHVFITSNSIVECAKIERKHGRPFKVPTVSEVWKASRDSARESLKK